MQANLQASKQSSKLARNYIYFTQMDKIISRLATIEDQNSVYV